MRTGLEFETTERGNARRRARGILFSHVKDKAMSGTDFDRESNLCCVFQSMENLVQLISKRHEYTFMKLHQMYDHFMSAAKTGDTRERDLHCEAAAMIRQILLRELCQTHDEFQEAVYTTINTLRRHVLLPHVGALQGRTSLSAAMTYRSSHEEPSMSDRQRPSKDRRKFENPSDSELTKGPKCGNVKSARAARAPLPTRHVELDPDAIDLCNGQLSPL